MLKVIDLFCGAGGFSLAALNRGCSIVGAMEMDAYACATYRNNILEKGQKDKLVEGDITRVDPESFLKRVKIKSRETDLVVGGPPCQGFSSLQDKDRDHDPRNELLLQYFKYVKVIAPKAFLIENVPGMLWPKHARYLKKFYQLADKNGYHVYQPVVLDAKNYGVPQTRKRVFIYGIRKDLKPPVRSSWAPQVTHGDPDSNEVRLGLLMPWLTSGQIFRDAIKDGDPNDVHMKHSADLIEVFKSTPKNGGSRSDSIRVLPCHKKHQGHKDVYGRIDPKKPAPTMTTSCTNPSKGRFV